MPVEPKAQSKDPDLSAHCQWPQRMVEMYDVLSDAFQRLGGLGKPQALDLARIGIAELGHYFGGRAVYLPRGKALQRALRDTRIHAEFTGRNHHELVDRYDLSVPTIYKILERQAELRRQRREAAPIPMETPTP